MKFLLSALAIVTVVACRDKSYDAAALVAPISSMPAVPVIADAGVEAAPATTTEDTYTPGEFKAGMSRFKDVGVYLDGKPIGFLSFGELPIALKPTWVKHKVNIEKKIDCKDCPIWAWGEQRYYKFNDYLRAIGVDPKTVREIHVQGPKAANSIVATGRDLSEPKADDFMFFFGLDVRGKPIPRVPLDFGNGHDPDKITAVMIYIKKTPPTFDNEGYVLDGRPIDGVPYFGEPLRGGVRVYLDDKLATIIKRQDLDAKLATTGSDGELSWSLWAFLKSRGVDTSKIVEGWVIRNDVRETKFPAKDLSTMTFEAPSKSGKSNSGAVLLGDQKAVANVIALHTRAIKPDELPVIRPDETN